MVFSGGTLLVLYHTVVLMIHAWQTRRGAIPAASPASGAAPSRPRA